MIKIFLVHGMTHTDPPWADNLIQLIAKRLRIDGEMTGCSPISIVTASSQGHPAHLCVETGSHAGIEYTFYALQWSPLTDPFKCTAPFLGDREQGHPIKKIDKSNLCANEKKLHYPVRRAFINGQAIKDVVMNDGFPDVLLYLAPQYWPVFRDAVAAALCYMYSVPSQQPCGPDSMPDPSPTEQYVFITHSLGANVLLDTLCEQIHCADTHPGAPSLDQAHRGPNLQRAIRTSFARPTPIYMLANQYAFLELSKAVPVAVSPLNVTAEGNADFLDVRNHPLFKALEKAPTTTGNSIGLGGVPGSTQLSIDIVAFSDPNDDLSFLLPSFPNDPAHAPITVQNVLVQNAPEYLWLFENPATAHLGYYQNPDNAGILDVIFCGMTASGVPKC